MPGHIAFTLHHNYHYMCWECWKKIIGPERPAAVETEPRTLDHCCWCGALHKSGIYFSTNCVSGADAICESKGGAHPVVSELDKSKMTGSTEWYTYNTRPKDEE